MNSKNFFLKSFLTLIITLYLYSISLSQTKNFQRENINDLKLSGFSDDDKMKLLILNILPSGLTEIAANEIARILELNIFNTNHFSVLGPSEWNSEIKHQNPTLADCHDISCGTMIGKLFGADKVLVGTLHSEMILNENNEEELNFILSIRMVDTNTNITNFSDEIQFNDLLMHDELFRLAARLSENTILIGKVNNIKQSGLFLNLGRAQGIETGHQLIVARKKLENDFFGNENKRTSNKNIAIAEVIQVSDMSSEAIIIQKILPITRGDIVKTFVDKEKLILLVSQTRKELDTQKRLKPKRQILSIDQSFSNKNYNYEKWSKLYDYKKNLHDRWLYITSGVGAATIIFLSGIVKTNGVFEVLPWAAGAGTIYSGFNYLNYRQELDELSVEGRSLGFISSSFDHISDGINLISNYNGIKVSWIKKF